MINIIIPAAGLGSRFSKAGYTVPKPLIDVNGKKMIQIVSHNVKPTQESTLYFIMQEQHLKQYNAYGILQEAAKPHGMVVTSILEPTDGAARTVLTVESLIDKDSPLLICNSDQYIDNFSINKFLEAAKDYDGYILTMTASESKWSFVGRGAEGLVDFVAEKEPISNEATCGIYYFKSGRAFIKAAYEMIDANDRTNNEFYLCPVYNYLLKAGGRVETMKVDGMHGMGTPEDLELFLKTDAVKRATDF